MSAQPPLEKHTLIRDAVARGGVVLLPTETVIGMAADATDNAAVQAIFDAKGRTPNKPLAVCIVGLAQAEGLAEFSDTARALANEHWPGALTLVLPAKPESVLVQACLGDHEGSQTVALRCPDVAWRPALCEVPLALTSANLSGKRALTDMNEARATFPGLPFVDGTGNPSGTPSTIVRVVGERVELLRSGEIVLGPHL